METRRFDFFVCYTRALKDFVKQLEEEEKNQSNGHHRHIDDDDDDDGRKPNGKRSARSTPDSVSKKKLKSSFVDEKKYSIDGKSYTLDEIKELVAKPKSDMLEKTIQEREKYSKRLRDVLISQACKVRETCIHLLVFK